MLSQAIAYLNNGLCALPAIAGQKRPAVNWKQFQSTPPSVDWLRSHWPSNADAICLVCGKVSGNLEIIDFDLQGELFGPWLDLVDKQAPGLADRLVIESSQSGGIHVFVKSDVEPVGNLKLASRQIEDKVKTLIETRGEGGICLVAPSPGYELTQGKIEEIPILAEEERDILFGCAWMLDEIREPEPTPQSSPQATSICGDDVPPGKDFDERGDMRAVLRSHGWTLAREGDNEYWRRPDKSHDWSATLKQGIFYVHSSNCHPFEAGKAYRAFAVYALLECGGDFSEAASRLRREGYGSPLAMPDRAKPIITMPSFSQVPDLPVAPDRESVRDPGPTPASLLRVPGFVEEYIDYAMTTSHHPDLVLSFAGAMALMSLLTGRKVQDSDSGRTNLYILALAGSGFGKDHVRKINAAIVAQTSLAGSVKDSFGSGEGIEDALVTNPALLYQVDEFDGIITKITKDRDGRFESIVTRLLALYGSANSLVTTRSKANTQSSTLDQPHLSILGTAIPQYFYEALSTKMLSNGFLARLIIVECSSRSNGRRPGIIPIPEPLLEKARWWADYKTTHGNLAGQHPQPRIVPETPEAGKFFDDMIVREDKLYAMAEKDDDPAAQSVWARTSEKVRRLSLIYACSENHLNPLVTIEAAEWAAALVEHQTQRMLFMADRYATNSEFAAKCEKVYHFVKSQGTVTQKTLCRKFRWSSREFQEIQTALSEQGRLSWSIRQHDGAGRPITIFSAI